MEPINDATVAQLDDFDEVIDVRSPSEFALDHVPGAMNCPVLDDQERARVGTLYKQISPFEARRAGAALVARNIARHLETSLADRSRHWRPAVYCWRGGGRSDAFCEILRRVGWRAAKLKGGYRAYRRGVVEDMDMLPRTLRFRVLCGRTGTGKSRILQALSDQGAQVLDLERLACHRGSVLGDLPGLTQPTQKFFESLLLRALRTVDSAQPIFVEAESRKVGNVQIPPALIEAIRSAPCIVIDADIALRVKLLQQEYQHLMADSAALGARLEALTAHYGRAAVSAWMTLAAAGRHADLVSELLAKHYDPAYDRSIARNFPQLEGASVVRLTTPTDEGIRKLALRLLETSSGA